MLSWCYTGTMTTNEKTALEKVYVLELVGDPINSSGCVTIEVAGTSLDRSKLEKLMVQKDEELDECFDGHTEPCDCDDEGCEEDHDGGEWCYLNSDYSSRPTWTINEYPLL